MTLVWGVSVEVFDPDSNRTIAICTSGVDADVQPTTEDRDELWAICERAGREIQRVVRRRTDAQEQASV